MDLIWFRTFRTNSTFDWWGILCYWSMYMQMTYGVFLISTMALWKFSIEIAKWKSKLYFVYTLISLFCKSLLYECSKSIYFGVLLHLAVSQLFQLVSENIWWLDLLIWNYLYDDRSFLPGSLYLKGHNRSTSRQSLGAEESNFKAFRSLPCL